MAVLRLPASLRPYQVDLLRSVMPEVVAIGAVQTGKSFALACWLLGQAWEWRTHPSWWIAPTYQQANVGYEEIVRIAQESGVIARTWLGKKIQLVNGAVIEFRSWERDENLLGPSVGPMVIDQAEMLTPRAHTIISTRRAATQAPICYGGNAGFRGAELWRIKKLAEVNPTGTMRLMTWGWEEYRDTLKGAARARYEAFIEAEKVRLPTDEFRRMYSAEFLDLGAGLVDLRPVCVNGGDELDPIGLPYEEPWDPDEDCVAGLDLGQIVDYTVLTVIGMKTGRLKAADRFKTLAWRAQAARICKTLSKYSRRIQEARESGLPSRSVSVYVDATGLGSPVGEILEEESAKLAVDLTPVTFTTAKKHRMVTSVQVAVEREEISMPYLLDYVMEAEALERKLTQTGISYGAVKGFHDDCFWSLGLACLGRT